MVEKIHGFDPAPEPAAGSEKPLAVKTSHCQSQDVEEKPGVPDQGVVLGDIIASNSVDASDFVQMAIIPGEKVSCYKPPPSFMNRAAYRALAEEDLVNLPPLGSAGLWCHASAQQWHAHHGVKKINFAPSWGNSRSETMAILLAIEKLWLWYAEENPSDEEAAKQLSLLVAKMSQTDF